jgi:hypothetical protein
MQNTDDQTSDFLSSDGEECFIPTASHSTLAPDDCAPPTYASAARAARAAVAFCPQENTTFIIRDPRTGLVIALKDGILGLHPDEKERKDSGTPHHGRGSHWHCVENEDYGLGSEVPSWDATSGITTTRGDDGGSLRR